MEKLILEEPLRQLMQAADLDAGMREKAKVRAEDSCLRLIVDMVDASMHD